MSDTVEFDPSKVIISYGHEPLKRPEDSEESLMPMTEVQEAAYKARDSIVLVDYRKVLGICMDERRRESYLSGKPTESGPGAPGDPDGYALIVGVLTGVIDVQLPAVDQMKMSVDSNKKAQLRGAAHLGCAGVGAIFEYMKGVAGDPQISGMVESQFNSYSITFDPKKLQQVTGFADRFVSSGTFKNWTEEQYHSLLGEDKDDQIEVMADRFHEGKLWIRNRIPDSMVTLRNNRGFVNEDDYLHKIEVGVADYFSNANVLELAPYAREAALAALTIALPNPELHQVTFSL